jgi:ribose/xylose/arabinose/galactoside ABC-type transport system permease subunit
MSEARWSAAGGERGPPQIVTTKGKTLAARATRLRGMALIPAIILAIVVGAFTSNVFLTPLNFLNVAQQATELTVLVVAAVMILLVGKLDISLESTVGLAPMVAAFLIVPASINGSAGTELSPYFGISITLAMGMAIGLFNGILIVKLKLSSFIVTLAMLILLRGIAIGVTDGRTMYDLPEPFLYLGSAAWFGVPVSVWFAAALVVVAALVLSRTAFGRAIYAIGGNAKAALAAGIRVDRVVLTVFVIAGALAAVAGLMLAGRVAAVPSSMGQNMIFTVLASSVIGGIGLNGGKGTILGAFTGVVLLSIIQNILTLSSVPSYWIDAVFGAIILFALILARATSGEKQED